MLDALRFVQGAVAKKDFVMALTHYQIKGGRVKAHNGGMTLCAPIDLDIDITPKASQFVKAILTCQGAISLHVTASKRLAVKSGKFRAYVDCIENDVYPTTDPEGDHVEITGGGMVKALKIMLPFIAEDASRPWARGIMLRDQSAFATNNVVLVEYWLGYSWPRPVNIPKAAIVEMCRIGEDPTHMQVCESSVTFFYKNGSWLKTSLYSLEWPDLSKVLSRPSAQVIPPEGLWDALESIAPFANKARQVFFKDGAVSTDPTEEATGAIAEVPGLAFNGVYNVDYLLGISDSIKTVDFSAYPAPVIFYGENIRGAIVGMRGPVADV